MARKVARYGLLIALAMIFSYVEVLIPFPIPVPGIKLGLANLVVITALYLGGFGEAAWISLIRVLLVGFTFGNPFSMWYSIGGAVLSLSVMAMVKRLGGFSIIGVSILGGVLHNIGQIAVAALVLQSKAVFVYLPALMIGGIITGALIGVVGKRLVRMLKGVY